MKNILKILSLVANSEKIVLFEKEEDRFNQLAELEKGCAGILTLDSLNLIFSRLDENPLLISENEFSEYEIIDDSLKFILSQKIIADNRTILLIVFSSKKNGFSRKCISSCKYFKELLQAKLNESGLSVFGAYKESIEAMPVPLYEASISGDKIFLFSQALTDIFGFTREDLTGNKFFLLRSVFPEYVGKIRKLQNSVESGMETTVEYWMKDKNGIERFIQHSVAPIVKNGKPVRVVGTLLDITREINLRNRLETVNKKFKTLLELSNELIFSLNRSGYFMVINDQSAVELGYNPGDMIGKHFLEFISEEDKPAVAIAFQKILKSSDAVSFDVKMIDSLMKEIPYKITAVSLKSGNEVTGVIGYGKNLKRIFTEERKLKELNEKLLEANRLLAIERDRASAQVTELEKLNDLKNEFISNVSHELRTPLASIIGFAETISSDDGMPYDLIKEFNEIIVSEGKRLTKLIDDILDFSKLEENKETLEYSSFDIVDTVNSLLESYKIQIHKKGLELIANIPHAEFIINGDKRRIETALANVISNSVKFTPRGKTITVSVNSFLSEVQIIIKDTGVGIPKDELGTVFQKFRKANRVGFNKPGAGIGLALVKQIIDLHKGTVTIKSELDKGTEVEIRLPKNME